MTTTLYVLGYIVLFIVTVLSVLMAATSLGLGDSRGRVLMKELLFSIAAFIACIATWVYIAFS